MALSNWDTLALNEKGQSISGVFRSPLGIEVEFYKNWLYVRDEKGWSDGAFMRPTVMEVQEGDIRYKDVEILAFRGPQNGIYAVIWSGSEFEKTLQGMIGCGVYGFEDGDETHDPDYIGVLPASIEWFRTKLRETRTEPMVFWTTMFEKEQTVRHKVVVPPEPDWYIHDVPEVFRTMDWNRSSRFNQGDEYFAKQLGDETLRQQTNPGEAQSPLMIRWLKGKEEKT